MQINIEPSPKKSIKIKKQTSNTTLADKVIEDHLSQISSLNLYYNVSYKLYLQLLFEKQNIVNASTWDVASEVIIMYDWSFKMSL